MMGFAVAPLIEPVPGDHRFKDPEWDKNPFFDFCKQAYLLACKWAEDQLPQRRISNRTSVIVPSST